MFARDIMKAKALPEMSRFANTTHRSSIVSHVLPSVRTANTTSPSSPINQFIIPKMHQTRDFSIKGDTPPPVKKAERSPIVQAYHKLPENKLAVGFSTPLTACSKTILLTLVCQATFLYHKLHPEQIPKGWSNDPVDLERALSIPVSDCGDDFKAPMPILVFVHHNEVITWFLFGAGTKFYFYDRKTSAVHEITESDRLDEVLKMIVDVCAQGIKTALVGKVYGDDLECGSLMAAS